MKSSALHIRGTAVQALLRYERTRQHLDHILTDYHTSQPFSLSEKAILTEIVNGTVRWRTKIDWILSLFLQKHDRKLPATIRQILRIAVYQILENPNVAPEIVVNESVILAKKYGHAGTQKLSNAVLRNVVRNIAAIEYPDITKQPAEHIAVLYSHPQWLVERWLTFFPIEEVIALCKANNRRPDLYLRMNLIQTSLDGLQDRLKTEGIQTEPAESFPDYFLKVSEAKTHIFATRAFKDGLFQPQDPAAGLVVKLACPQKHMSILDMCAAPGGKTTFLAELTRNSAFILALDNKIHKLQKLDANSHRLQLPNIFPVVADGTSFRATEAFDLVLVDAPCSGSGVLSRRSDARWQRQPEDFSFLIQTQQRLLENAACLVRPGGVLVYSTCSIDPEENEQNVVSFLNKNKDFLLDDAMKFLPEKFCNQGFYKTLPHLHGIDGSFAARLLRH